MNHSLVRNIVLATLFGLLWAKGQEPLRITFDGPPEQPPGTSVFVEEYYERGMWFRPLGEVGPGNGFDLRKGGGQLAGAPDNGTAYLAAAFGDSLVFSFIRGAPFNLVSIDLAEYSTVLSDRVTVPFFGYRSDGTVVSAQFTTDGIGPLPDFQRFYFGPEFSGLTRVEIPTWGWSLDNIEVMPIPEPGTVLLLFAGGLLVFCMHLRKT